MPKSFTEIPYVPKIHHMGGNGVYIEMCLEGKLCPVCNKPMLNKHNFNYGDNIFPNYYIQHQKAQMERCGIEFISSAVVDNERICEACAAQGKACFKCHYCNAMLSSELIEKSFGEPAEYLCKNCYETLSAKKWDEAVKQLEDDHEYDYE